MGDTNQALTREITIENTLRRLVAEQRAELNNSGFHDIPSDGEKMFEWFKTTKEFNELYNQALKYNLLPCTDQRINELITAFAGRLYQDMAYAFLAGKRLSHLITVLSPEKTLEFYILLYHENKKYENLLGLDSLEGISVPDGILTINRNGREHILSVCEYTLTGVERYFRRKYDSFNINLENNPQILSHASIVFEVPKDVKLPSYLEKKDKIKMQKMPFTRRQFGNFVRRDYGEYPPDEDCATLDDIQSRARKQLERGIGYQIT